MALVALCAAASWRCGGAGCLVAGTNRLDQLTLQLDGGCCGFHSQATGDQPDNSCKAIGVSLTYSLSYGEHECVAWAADCLAEMGESARPAVPALIEALRNGPNNFDTGDGVIHTRERIALALGATGDPRALGALLEALANPKPYDVGLGAAGYASRKPVGQAAALSALGMLGPEARPAVDIIVTHLDAPIEDYHDARVVEAAAEALGKIGDARALPPLIRALQDPPRAVAAARALGTLGPAAVEAAPVLKGLVESDPEGEHNDPFRYALFAIAGRAAYEALPKNYRGMLAEILRSLRRGAKARGLRVAGSHDNGPSQRVKLRLAAGEEITVTVDRDIWIARRAVAGDLRLERDGALVTAAAHSSLAELEHNIESLFAGLASH